MSPDADTEPDYSAVEIPRGKAPDEYNVTERRAELLDLVHARGSPHALNQTRLGQRYGVSQPMISKDLDRLGEYVADSLGERRSLQGRALYERCVKGLLDDEDWRGAAQVQTMYEKWLDRRTGDESAGEGPTAGEPRTESDSYRIVDDVDDSVRVTVAGGTGDATGEEGDADGGTDATDDAPTGPSGARGATDDSPGAVGDAADESSDSSASDTSGVADDADPGPDGGDSADPAPDAGDEDPDADFDVDGDGVVRDADGRVIGRRVEQDADPGTADAARTNGENDENDESEGYDPGGDGERSDLEPRDWRSARSSPSRHALFRDG